MFTHAMLEYNIDLSAQGINRFTLTADDSDEVPDLQGAKTYAGFKLSSVEWDKIELI